MKIIKIITITLSVLMIIIFLGISHVLLYPNIKLIFGILFMCEAVYFANFLMEVLLIRK